MRVFKGKFMLVGLALVITIVFAGIYVTIQQTLRYSADEPQRSIAQDVARDLTNNKRPTDLAPGYINIASNMAPFVIIYDQYGKVVAGNGYLDNKVPQVPIGVLVASRGHTLNKVTWQPKEGARVASVSTQAGDYYVLGGRSLDVVEGWVGVVGKLLAVGWLVCMATLVVVYRLFSKKSALTQ